jgi:hypothetical protein
MIKSVRYQFVMRYSAGQAALTAAVEDITLALSLHPPKSF